MSDWLEALRVASESTAIDLVTAGVLDEIRHALVVGRLVDREAIDYEAILLEYDPEFAARRTGMFAEDWALLRSELERAAIGGSDEK